MSDVIKAGLEGLRIMCWVVLGWIAIIIPIAVDFCLVPVFTAVGVPWVGYLLALAFTFFCAGVFSEFFGEGLGG